ncbi:MAG: ATP-binding protein [Paludibacteraceae bacterium]|nr:ATP-binding protein [Paludibacteraceae bacterium]
MQRDLMTKLVEWKDSPRRKPLILLGARQVGKTWLMKEFGKNYFKNLVYISFYRNDRIAAIFEKDYNVHRIIDALQIELGVTIVPQETLIVFDEVQNALSVVESLKYFCEDAAEYAIIASGSLLGVALHHGISFPVGKVDELHLYPLTFCEFLKAMEQPALAGFVANCNYEQINDFREKYTDLLKDYMFVGGMPEVVEAFRLSRNYDEARSIQMNIISQYEDDFGKHIESSTLPRIRMVWNTIPVQLAKENRKFFFGQVKEGARLKDFEIAIQWLVDCGLLLKVHKISKPNVPLKSYLDFNSFKLYLLDVGLLGALSGLNKSSVLLGSDVFVEFKGALAEQYVLQQLSTDLGYVPYYYSGDKSTYEIDFIIQREGGIVPIEVMAEENLKAKSLRVFCDKFHPLCAYRFSMSNYREQDWLVNIPLWAVSTVKSLN